MAILVRTITAADTHPLRLQVLRPGGTLADVDFANDRLEGAFHLGAFQGNELVGVGSFYPEKHRSFRGNTQHRLRGMATHPDQRGKGVGGALLRHGLDELKLRQVGLLWCNARIKAAPFYERLGFETLGEPFELPGIGIHYLMHRMV